MNLCKWKDILGKPNSGIHSIRLFNISIVDVLLTILLAFFINRSLFENPSSGTAPLIGNWKMFIVVLIFCFCLGIILHKIFCVDTTIGKWLNK
jgi:hypothetical protein